jgi:hypothetical protein
MRPCAGVSARRVSRKKNRRPLTLRSARVYERLLEDALLDHAHEALGRTRTARRSARPAGAGAESGGNPPVDYDSERRGPVAQPVFKTGQVWQPQAG